MENFQFLVLFWGGGGMWTILKICTEFVSGLCLVFLAMRHVGP